MFAVIVTAVTLTRGSPGVFLLLVPIAGGYLIWARRVIAGLKSSSLAPRSRSEIFREQAAAFGGRTLWIVLFGDLFLFLICAGLVWAGRVDLPVILGAVFFGAGLVATALMIRQSRQLDRRR